MLRISTIGFVGPANKSVLSARRPALVLVLFISHEDSGSRMSRTRFAARDSRDYRRGLSAPSRPRALTSTGTRTRLALSDGRAKRSGRAKGVRYTAGPPTTRDTCDAQARRALSPPFARNKSDRRRGASRGTKKTNRQREIA